MKPVSATLQGIGVAVPPGRLDQDAATALAQARCCTDERERAWLRRVYRHSGIRKRGSVLIGPEHDTAGFERFYPVPATTEERGPTTATRIQRYVEEAAPLGERACRAALEQAQAKVASITHLVMVSCTGMVSPGLDAQLIQRLGLSPDIGRLNLGFMGCHGALNGLRAAEGLLQASSEGRVLLCCVELCSLHFQYGWDMQKVIANGLFADGAGAVVLDGIETGDRQGWRLVETRSRLAEDSSEAMTWRVGNHGFEMTLSSEVPKRIRGALRPWVEQWLAEHDLRLGDVRHWAIHPGGPEILRAARQALALPEQASHASEKILAEHGNMSSPTVLFVLERMRRAGASGPCVVLGFGPGLSFEAALLR
ncbi:type III polyketide synthase [Modicisalibacter luteus]|uniref:Type III polyketide synthase n=1 Tax=Modicisalibacter luteus TaxID=453962 RepID=A0ABV7LX26_9GAMM|nr:type III polyketide synthase [Halomonas lutea]GHB10505.1 chalcone synthase [Halomonas lutea]